MNNDDAITSIYLLSAVLPGCVGSLLTTPYHATEEEKMRLFTQRLGPEHVEFCETQKDQCAPVYNTWAQSIHGKANIRKYEQRMSRYPQSAPITSFSNVSQGYQPNAYGLGQHSDGTGRSFQWVEQHSGQAISPITPVRPNAYGPGVGMDVYGRAVRPAY